MVIRYASNDNMNCQNDTWSIFSSNFDFDGEFWSHRAKSLCRGRKLDERCWRRGFQSVVR